MIRLQIIISLAVIMLLSGCITSTDDNSASIRTSLPSSTPARSISPTKLSGAQTLMIFAAASLTGAFQEIGGKFEAINPGVKVSFNFAGSQILRTQLEQGAVADVFASADHKNMDALETENLLAANSYQDFATNKLIVIMPGDNPADIQSLIDLSKPGMKLILADSSVPAGNYARQILEKLSKDPLYGVDFSKQVLANVVSNETDVKQVVAKVELGEGDAAIVYITDAMASPDLKTITIPTKFNILASYPIAVMSNAQNPIIAKAFVDYVISSSGQSILSKWGFSEVNH